MKDINIFGKKNIEQGIPPKVNDETGKPGVSKLLHIVEMTNDEIRARKDATVPPGSTVLAVKKQLGYGPKDSLIRAKDRQILHNDSCLHDIAEPGEKYIVVPNTEVGV